MFTLSLSAGEVCVVQPGVLLLQDVFAVKVKRRRGAGQESGGAVLGVALFYCKRRGRKLEEDTLHLHNASAEHTHTWYNTLNELLTGNAHTGRRGQSIGFHIAYIVSMLHKRRDKLEI